MACKSCMNITPNFNPSTQQLDLALSLATFSLAGSVRIVFTNAEESESKTVLDSGFDLQAELCRQVSFDRTIYLDENGTFLFQMHDYEKRELFNDEQFRFYLGREREIPVDLGRSITVLKTKFFTNYIDNSFDLYQEINRKVDFPRTFVMKDGNLVLQMDEQETVYGKVYLEETFVTQEEKMKEDEKVRQKVEAGLILLDSNGNLSPYQLII